MFGQTIIKVAVIFVNTAMDIYLDVSGFSNRAFPPLTGVVRPNLIQQTRQQGQNSSVPIMIADTGSHPNTSQPSDFAFSPLPGHVEIGMGGGCVYDH